MTTPAIRALKESVPGRRVTLLTSSSGARLLPLVPEVDDVIVHDAAWMKASAEQPSGASERRLVARLRARRFDAAVVFTVYSQSPLPAALACHLADVPLRLAHCRENPYRLLTDWVRETEPEHGTRHEVQRQLDLVATIGCRTHDERLSLTVPSRALEEMRGRLAELGMDRARPWVVIHPGASAASRRYPAERFAVVVRQLAWSGCPIVFVGAQDETPLVELIRGMARVPSISLTGTTDLAQLAALLSLAPLLIANNSGPVHVAAAVGTPVVDLYALTNPQHTPWRIPSRVLSHDVPCKYCYKSICPEGHNACLSGVAPERVVRAASELLLASGRTGLGARAFH